jgi:hypothetical protein
MEDRIFDISFFFDEKHYKGFVNPSEKLNEEGIPASFHVVLNETAFGDLSFNKCRWTINETRPSGLVSLVGKQIEKHYQL